MATKIAKKINQWFVKYASEHIVSIDEDNDGLYCEVISESDEDQTYNVHCDESGLVPVATSCKCEGHTHGYTCKHMQAVNLYYARIYASNIVKFEAKQAAQVEVVETPEEIVPSIAMELPAELRGYRKTAVSVDISTKGNLNGQQGFSVLRKVG